MDTHTAQVVRWAATAFAAIAATPLLAAPLVFEETAKIPSPDPNYRFPRAVAVEGDTIIATGVRFDGPIETHTAFLFQRRSPGAWQFVRALGSGSCDSGESAEDTCNGSVAIRNGVAVFSANTVHVYLRGSDGGWTEAQSNATAGPGDAAVGNGAVFAGESVGCYFATRAFRPNSSGIWSLAATLPGPSYPGCDHWGVFGSDIDVSPSNHVIVGNTQNDNAVQIHEQSGSGWTQTAELVGAAGESGFGGAVAMDDYRAFVAGGSRASIHVYSRAGGTWTHEMDIIPPGGAPRPTSLKTRGLLFAGYPLGDRGGSVAVFKESTLSERFEQVARLVTSDGFNRNGLLGSEVDGWVNGTFARIVAAERERGLYVFDLNFWGMTPAPRQEDFEQGNAANWTPLAGSTFAVATSGGSKVYRQSALTGTAGAYVNSVDRTNQSIEADIKPTAFDGADRWVGLAVRRIDASNYYYAALRQSNVLELKRMVNGVFTTLASAPVQVVLNRNYRLRVEAVGTLVRAYVNSELILQARDTALTHGVAGIQMYKARADLDNVILSPNPQLTFFAQPASAFFNNLFDAGPGTWSVSNVVQTSTADGAHAVSITDVDDQIVQARVTANQFATGTGSRWFGLMARYRDAGNYYYVTMRSDNTISLRKLVNGTIQVLDSAPLTVTAGTNYSLRLEVIGTSLRAYVNGNVLLEATDTTHFTGKFGPVMYKTAATYTQIRGWMP